MSLREIGYTFYYGWQHAESIKLILDTAGMYVKSQESRATTDNYYYNSSTACVLSITVELSINSSK